jgi:hypothetical protein
MLSRASALGAVAALGALGPLALRPAPAAEKTDPGDVKLLAGALALELAAIKAYTDMSAANLSAPVATVIAQFSADHAAHRDALTGLVQQSGQTPAADLATLTIAQPQTVDLRAPNRVVLLGRNPSVQKPRSRENCGLDPRRRRDACRIAGRGAPAKPRLPRRFSRLTISQAT